MRLRMIRDGLVPTCYDLTKEESHRSRLHAQVREYVSFGSETAGSELKDIHLPPTGRRLKLKTSTNVTFVTFYAVLSTSCDQIEK
jgi:hypothetical protein